MESHVECAQSRDYVSDSSDQNSPSIKKSQKTNLHASPSMSSISSPGSTASYAIPTGSPGDSYKYKYSSRNTLSNPQKLDFEKPSGLALNNNPGIAINYDALSIEELITKKQQAKASIKQIDEMIQRCRNYWSDRKKQNSQKDIETWSIMLKNACGGTTTTMWKNIHSDGFIVKKNKKKTQERKVD